MQEKKPNYHHGDLRQALIDAALARLREGGATALSLRALAKDVGVSATAVYRHFADKESLLAAIATEGFEGLKRETLLGRDEADAGNQPADPLARFAGIGRGYVRYAREHPAHYRLMFGPRMLDIERYPDLARAASESYAVLETTVAEGVNAGALKHNDIQLLSTTAWSLVHGLASLIIDGLIDSRLADDQLTDRILQIMTQGTARGDSQ